MDASDKEIESNYFIDDTQEMVNHLEVLEKIEHDDDFRK